MNYTLQTHITCGNDKYDGPNVISKYQIDQLIHQKYNLAFKKYLEA